MSLHLHTPNRTLWIIAAVLFILGLIFGSIAFILSAALLLLGTWLI